METILLTGFGPFSYFKENPSEYIARKLDGLRINNKQIQSWVLPTSFDKVPSLIEELIQEVEPRYIIHLGLAGNRNEITPELIAINHIDCKETPDIEGKIISHQKIDPKSKEAFFTSLPNEEIIKNLRHHNYPASLSVTAGTYVCNYTLYKTLQLIEKNQLKTQAGFIHIPNTIHRDKLAEAIMLSVDSLPK